MMFQLQLLACGQRNLGSEYYHRALLSKIGLSTTYGSFADVVNVGTPIRFSCGKAILGITCCITATDSASCIPSAAAGGRRGPSRDWDEPSKGRGQQALLLENAESLLEWESQKPDLAAACLLL
jgi:hypothetical protein